MNNNGKRSEWSQRSAAPTTGGAPAGIQSLTRSFSTCTYMYITCILCNYWTSVMKHSARHFFLLVPGGNREWWVARPYHPVMAAHDVTGRQKIFMSFRVILSNTASLSAFLYEDTCVQGSANAPRMPAMSAHLTWMIYLGQSRARAHHALQPRIMNNGVDLCFRA